MPFLCPREAPGWGSPSALPGRCFQGLPLSLLPKRFPWSPSSFLLSSVITLNESNRKALWWWWEPPRVTYIFPGRGEGGPQGAGNLAGRAAGAARRPRCGPACTPEPTPRRVFQPCASGTGLSSSDEAAGTASGAERARCTPRAAVIVHRNSGSWLGALVNKRVAVGVSVGQAKHSGQRGVYCGIEM